MSKRPDWVKDVERLDDGRTALVIEGKDGRLRGVVVPSQSMRNGERRREQS